MGRGGSFHLQSERRNVCLDGTGYKQRDWPGENSSRSRGGLHNEGSSKKGYLKEIGLGGGNDDYKKKSSTQVQGFSRNATVPQNFEARTEGPRGVRRPKAVKSFEGGGGRVINEKPLPDRAN